MVTWHACMKNINRTGDLASTSPLWTQGHVWCTNLVFASSLDFMWCFFTWISNSSKEPCWWNMALSFSPEMCKGSISYLRSIGIMDLWGNLFWRTHMNSPSCVVSCEPWHVHLLSPTSSELQGYTSPFLLLDGSTDRAWGQKQKSHVMHVHGFNVIFKCQLKGKHIDRSYIHPIIYACTKNYWGLQ